MQAWKPENPGRDHAESRLPSREFVGRRISALRFMRCQGNRGVPFGHLAATGSLGRKMGKHKWLWLESPKLTACVECGVLLTTKTDHRDCPLFATGEGETTKANRAHETGEIKKLRKVRALVEEISRSSKKAKELLDYRDKCMEEASKELEIFIQKHEGLARG